MDVEGTTLVQPPTLSTHSTTTAHKMLQSLSSPPPSPLLSRLAGPQSPSRGSALRLPGVASVVIKLRRGRHSGEVKALYPVVSTSGEPKTHPRLVGDGVTSPGKVPLVEEQRFLCKDGVDVKKLLRMIRAGLLEEAQSIGASVLVDEQ